MNPIEIIEKFGIPVAVAMAFGFFIWKQNKYIQDDLTKDIHQKFNRLEGIIIKLIDQQKKMQIEMRGIVRSYQSLVDIIQAILIQKVVKLIASQFKLDKILDYVENPNELDDEVQELKERIMKLEINSHAPRDFVICDMCKEKIKEK